MEQRDPVGELRAAIVQSVSGEVLMLAWMDDQALAATEASGLATFYSRSRGSTWVKGETSGHRLPVVSLRADCDGDAILVVVDPDGPACHTSANSCFAPWLWRTVADRAANRPASSYTAALLEQGVGHVARKVGEEAVETVVAALAEDDTRLVEEAADLYFHLLVLLAARGIDIAAVDSELAQRHRP
jgi:phosphoribosyl-AMP cyclohydrolase / phosphoribosyl-ATP pyrophosphohydrolase